MISKKGEDGFQLLGGFSVKLILAVLCILVLIGLAVYISHAFIKDTRDKQAAATISELVGEINSLGKSNVQEIEYAYRSPSEWYMHSSVGQIDKKFYLCICSEAESSSCSQAADICQETSCQIVLDPSIIGKSLAKERAVYLLVKKEGNCFRISLK